MAHELTFEQIQTCKNVFDSKKIITSDDEDDSKMHYRSLKEAINAIIDLKHKLTEDECEEIKTKLNLSDEIDFPTFLRIAALKFKNQEFLNALVESFKAFDKNHTGNLCYDDLRSIMTDFGPKISMDDADKLLDELDLLNINEFDYNDFVYQNL